MLAHFRIASPKCEFVPVRPNVVIDRAFFLTEWVSFAKETHSVDYYIWTHLPLLALGQGAETIARRPRGNGEY
jgi:hypothetical protein